MQRVQYGESYSDSGFRRIMAMFDAEHGSDDGDHDGTLRQAAWEEFLAATPDVLAVKTDGEWQAVQQSEDGRYTWQTRRHWLGDALFAARANGRRKRVKFISSFDRNERERLYFLCELPATSAIDIDGALQALKPDAVVLAEGMGRECERQGDIFAVPMTGLTTAQLRTLGGTVTRRSDALKGIHARTRADALFTRLVQAEDVRFRTPDYLQHRENMRRASWGRVPWGTPRAEPIGGAWRTNRYADAVGQHRAAKWQTILRDRAIATAATAIDGRDVSLLGTAHTATHVCTMPDGTQYGRGTMYHDPALMGEDRERDHARRKMGDGKTWHLIVKNTVPVQ
jgi:hypothetical protein